ncbi:hypothetical protein [Streptomyces chryseus]|uniref:Secreted protein n=1 Tax=Streptomyces chryseus TaxID=68186 RepID=A0ABQ3DQF5_9ACTN|nr:hypothetical protein [Streptomyces chryseus]GHB08076.1 hypothetical protein GCM10010346_34290 [Streptomyces chryseus]
MTALAAHPLVALRVLRRAGRRRALRVVLFLGGLLAVGFLWGGQAYAVEAPSPHRTAVATVDAVASLAPAASTAPAVPTVPAAPAVPAHAHLSPKGAVREVVEPAAGVVRGITRPVGELTDRVAEHRPTLPGIPAPPALPVPDLPVPQAPAMPEVPTPPAGGGADSPGEPEQTVRQGSGDRASQAAGQDSGTGATAPAAVAEQSVYAYRLPVPQRHDADGGPGRAKCGETPVPTPSAPCGDGVRQSAGDGSSARSGDKHAAALTSAARFGPVRGATLPATAAPTYDRPHEILEFPG